MTTVTIPGDLADRRDLIAVPRREYEEFVAWQRKRKSARTFAPTSQEKRALTHARKRRVQGKHITLDELGRSLGITS